MVKESLEIDYEELLKKLIFFKRELFNLRFQKSMGELVNTSRMSSIRKDVARVKTELVKRKKYCK